MRTIFFIVQKEFLQIFRNRSMIPIIFVMPIVQLLILSNAADYETKNISLQVIDRDLSQTSMQLVNKFRASGFFNVNYTSFDDQPALDNLRKDKVDLVLTIPPHFEKDLVKNEQPDIQMMVNAINGAKAGIVSTYAGSTIRSFNDDIRVDFLNAPKGMTTTGLNLEYAYWFNPLLNYKTFMVPGILVLLVTMIGMFLSGMNIVKEKEIGTIEQLNVTPIKKYQFIIGKLLPFWLIGLFELAFGLTIGKLVFDIPMLGNLFYVFSFAAIYLILILGIGLLVSTFTDTQQQAMFISWFIMVIFILMSGLFTAIESMPIWAQKITLFNPIAYFVRVIRMVLLKGSGFADIAQYFLILLGFAAVVNGLAVWNYRKTAA
jgi:ABC-2 type transport system permease protein